MRIADARIGMRLRLKSHVPSRRKELTWMVVDVQPTFIRIKAKDRQRVLYASHMKAWDEVKKVAEWENQ